MPGSRPLTPHEERALVRRIRGTNTRDRALITTQLFTGFRISEVLSFTISHVIHRGVIRDKLGLPPRFLKGGYGHTRWVPIGPELYRALEAYLARRSRHEDLDPHAPLFLSREHNAVGGAKPLCRSSAEKLIKRHLLAIADGDPQGLSSHSLRKTWARRLYERSEHDLMLVRDGLGHSSVAVTQKYLSTDRDRLEKLILAGDWTRRARKSTYRLQTAGQSRTRVVVAQPHTPASVSVTTTAPVAPTAATPFVAPTTAWLPGFEASPAA